MTHADYFYGEIPCTRELSDQEIETAYELEIGNVIIETLNELHLEATAVPGVLVTNHAPFCWGKDADEAVHNAVVLEEIFML